MGRASIIGLLLLGGAACAGQPASQPAREVLSELTCADGKRWQGKPCGVDDPPLVTIARPAGATTAPFEVAAAAEVEGSQVPSFLELGIEPRKRYPLRATIHRSGTLYERRDGGILDAGDDHSVLWTEVVLDPDRDGVPRRPRLLCNEHSHRVAVHRDAEDLAPVALDGTLVVPTVEPPTVVTELTPGVRLAAGALVSPVSQPEEGRRRIAFDGLFLEVEGFVDAALVDVVFEPKPLAEEYVFDGELIGDVELKDAPTGRVVAMVHKDPSLSNQLFIKRLSAPQGGHVLIRYEEHAARAVGWVPTGALRLFAPKRLGPGGGGGGYGAGVGPKIALAAGTLLKSDQSGAILGIVTRDDELRCEAGCEGTEPLLVLSACGGEVRLRAIAGE